MAKGLPAWKSLAAAVLVALLALPAAAALEDPTRPAEYAPTRQLESGPQPESQWVLTLIKYSGMGRMAVLNGRTVREGDAIGASRVVAIEPAAVILDREGHRVRVEFTRQAVKTQRARSVTGKGPKP
jgi:hypothetical protein